MEPLFIESNAPAAIAFSGGGDSTALLHAARTQANISHAFIVDHALRETSADEAERAADIARRFGYTVAIDRWEHDGHNTGIQAKARAYRYEALGRMCREANIQHLITAHSQDDQAETLLMRLDRQTGWRGLAAMPVAAYAPLWPALAEVTLHRPWLDKSRQELREYNAQHGLSYIDDPSNQNTDFARIRARQALAADPDLRSDLLAQQIHMRERLNAERKSEAEWLKTYASISRHGYIETSAIPSAELLLHILNCVSGRGGPIDAAKRRRLCEDMSSQNFTAATLGGAWIIRKSPETASDGLHNFVYLRDRVAVTGRDVSARVKLSKLERGKKTLWDGRFLIEAKTTDVQIDIASGHLQKLRQLPEFKSLFDLPKEVRESLPVFFIQDKPLAYGDCDTEHVQSRAMTASRLQGLYGNLHLVPV